MSEDRVPDDICENCETEYDFDTAKDRVVIYQLSPYASHIEAVCPACGTVTRIFCTPDGLRDILSRNKLPMQMGKYAPDHILESSHRVWVNTDLEPMSPMPNEAPPVQREVPTTADVPLPFPNAETPHWMLRELYDQMREWEKEN